MAINRASIRELLLPGLAGIEGHYKQIPAQWPHVFHRGSSKYAIERYVEVRNTGLAELKAEGGATQFDNAAGQRFVYNVVLRGVDLGFAITREALADNLYKDQFGPQGFSLVNSFNQTKEIFAANILNKGTTYDSQVGGDGVALFSTAHPIDGNTYANRPTTDLDLNEASIEAALNAIRGFPDQAGLKTFARGNKLIVPVARQWDAERLTKTELRVDTADNTVSAIYTTGALPGGYQVMDFLTSNYAWFLTTNVEGLAYFERDPYEMDLQVDPITGNLLVIGYERYGLAHKNPRAAWASFPTA